MYSDLRHSSLSETATLQSAAIIVTCNSSTGNLLVGAVIFVDIYLFVLQTIVNKKVFQLVLLL